MREIWFTSDLKLGGANAALARGFESADEMTELIVELWNAAVAPSDVVWILGGLGYDYAAAKRLHGSKYLLTNATDEGDGPHDDAKLLRKWQAFYREQAGITGLVTGTAFEKHRIPVHLPLAGGIDLWPYPYDVAAHVDPVPERRPLRPRRGSAPWLLHGDDSGDGRFGKEGLRQINVCLDRHAFAPVGLERIDFVINGNGGD